MFAHTSLEMGKAVEVFHTAMRRFITHPGVPAVKALGYPNKAAAR